MTDVADPNALPVSIEISRSQSHTQQVTRSDWENHRAQITALYIDQNLPLKKVIEVMQTEHGFKATTRMYKKRIGEWDLAKNNRKSEMEAIARSYKKRPRDDTEAKWIVRGREITPKELTRYFKRRRLDIEDVEGYEAVAEDPPSAVSVSHSSPTYPMTENRTNVKETTWCLSVFLESSFHGGHDWFTRREGDGESSRATLMSLPCNESLVAWLFSALVSSTDYQEVAPRGRSLALELINKLALFDCRLLMNYLPYTILDIYLSKKRPELARSVLTEFAASFHEHHGFHPMYQFCIGSNKLDEPAQIITLRQSVTLVYQKLASELGMFHRSTLIARQHWIRTVLSQDGPDAEEEGWRSYVQDCKQLAHTDTRALNAQVQLVQYLQRAKNFDAAKVEAVKLFQDVRKRVLIGDYSAHNTFMYQSVGYSCLADYEKAKGNPRQSDSMLSFGRKVEEQRAGRKRENVRFLMQHLGEWMGEAFKRDEASQMEEKVKNTWHGSYAIWADAWNNLSQDVEEMERIEWHSSFEEVHSLGASAGP